ncbi:Gfo/Idh/MocA family protein [Pseudoruegeria sp. SK021]|uniref:Gfo/Idh/MocA family protein n=1 Tax=Pseudoruegeria sp. SK021 TaxID=1933035 RepID=UPI000A2213A2|nr:Gfo/Idh/MocA family oxidoreductase [Pseudoruegeria sp. SK021]OSP56403.1 oxidoreductase [Pseudoruegeria sp. SK021]
MRRARYGLIGSGMMGQEHLRNIALLNGAEVAAIYEPDTAMQAMALALVPGATPEGSLTALLARDDLDGLVIASPNDCHLAQLEQIAAGRPLPVLVEKPLFTDPADRPRIVRLARTYAAPIWVAMEYRYMPPVAAVIAEAEAATGGVRMLSIREHRFPFLHKVGHWNRHNSRTGGTLVEKCCHFFDLMRLIVGAEPVRVMASGSQAVNHLDETLRDGPPDIWDNAFVIVDFANGVRAMLDLCMFAEGSEFQEEISVVGPLGKIEAKVPGPLRFWPGDPAQAPLPLVIRSPRFPKAPIVRQVPVDPALLAAGDHNGATFYQHQRFLDVVRGNSQPEVGLLDGLMAVVMGQAAQVSAQEGRAVSIDADAVMA